MSTHRFVLETEPGRPPRFTPRHRWLGWWGWALLAALIFLVALCAGCASTPAALPLCPVAKIYHAELDGKTWFYVDFDNLNAMRLRMLGLHERTCEPGEEFGVDGNALDDPT